MLCGKRGRHLEFDPETKDLENEGNGKNRRPTKRRRTSKYEKSWASSMVTRQHCNLVPRTLLTPAPSFLPDAAACFSIPNTN